MQFNLTRNAQIVFRSAKRLAERLHHSHLRTDLLVLAMLQQRQGVAAGVLQRKRARGARVYALLQDCRTGYFGDLRQF